MRANHHVVVLETCDHEHVAREIETRLRDDYEIIHCATHLSDPSLERPVVVYVVIFRKTLYI